MIEQISLHFVSAILGIMLFAISNYFLIPLINKYRGEKQNAKFRYSHFISVVINFVQMIFLTFLLI